VRPLPLAVTGLALVMLSWGTCNVVLDELYAWILVLTFFGGLIGGGAAFAVAAVRFRKPVGASAEIRVARGLGLAGTVLALGAASFFLTWPPFGAVGAALLGAVFILGVALTLGAIGLLTWAAHGPNSLR
jgi:hypothetical protein